MDCVKICLKINLFHKIIRSSKEGEIRICRIKHHYILPWIQHHRLGRSAFHTPGHSGKPISYLDHLLQLDVTELPDTDSLFEAEHVILQAEHHAAQVFGDISYPNFLPGAVLYVFRQCCVLFQLAAIKKQF